MSNDMIKDSIFQKPQFQWGKWKRDINQIENNYKKKEFIQKKIDNTLE